MNEIYAKSFISLLLALNRFRAEIFLAKGTTDSTAPFSGIRLTEFERRCCCETILISTVIANSYKIA